MKTLLYDVIAKSFGLVLSVHGVRKCRKLAASCLVPWSGAIGLCVHLIPATQPMGCKTSAP